MFTTGTRVSTEFGEGQVHASSGRRVVVALDSGESINVAYGTPGYDRITVLDRYPHHSTAELLDLNRTYVREYRANPTEGNRRAVEQTSAALSGRGA